jgi:hypothetical protein
MSGKQFLGVLLVAAVAAFAGATFAVRLLPPDLSRQSLSVREYHLLDAGGVRRASFEVSYTEEPTLILRDREGKRRAALSFSESGEVLWSRSVTAPDSVHLLTHDGRQASLTVKDSGVRPCAD